MNPNGTARSFDVVREGEFFSYEFQAKSAITFVWETAVAAPIGNYDEDGIVDQPDLDLMLSLKGATSLHSGFSTPALPDGFFDGLVDQYDIDAVLNNWGGAKKPTIPAPATLVGFALLPLLIHRI